VSLKSGNVIIKQKDNITGIRTAQRDEIQDLIQCVQMICIHKEKMSILKSGQYRCLVHTMTLVYFNVGTPDGTKISR